VHVPFKGNADLQHALLGVATSWRRATRQAGQVRRRRPDAPARHLREKRTKRWPNVPTAQELGYNVVSTSPYGLVGPKGMDPAVVKTLHDAFKKAMEEPRHVELLEQLNQDAWYRSGADYEKWARETLVRDKALIERLGLAAK
jgi:tripartite-type tricarboxylate transporter receptor subunit TctC